MRKHASSGLRAVGLSVLVTTLVAGCGGGGSSAVAPPPPSPSDNPPSLVHEVAPKSIDPQVSASENRDHVAINPNPDVTAKGRLFVMLAGTGGSPTNYRYVLQSGATRGFHALGLDYPNPTAVGQICAVSLDPDCFWNVRREVLTGTDYSNDIDIAPSDAIITRLNKALAYLDATYPAEGWGQYLSNGSVIWSKVIIAGHSQGGGHAGVIAKLFTVNRAVYFSSPADWKLLADEPAGWEASSGATPASSQYAFSHLDDGLVPWNQLQVIWRTMGLGQNFVSVDTNAAPFGNSRTLTTRATPADNGPAADPAHGATVQDNVTPLDGNGKPLFDPVWGYLAFQ